MYASWQARTTTLKCLGFLTTYFIIEIFLLIVSGGGGKMRDKMAISAYILRKVEKDSF